MVVTSCGAPTVHKIRCVGNGLSVWVVYIYNMYGLCSMYVWLDIFEMAYVTRSHKMVLKSILGATENIFWKEKMIIMVKKLVVSVKIKKLWRVKVSGSESSHFEKKQFKVVQHILGIFP